MTIKRTQQPDLPSIERRTVPLDDMALRADTDTGLLTFIGYASVTERAYDVAGGPPYGFSETIARDAFKKTLSESPDVVFLINHEGLPIARTASGTLVLDADDTGLRVEAELDPDDPDVQRIRPKMERGDLDQMSFAFRVIRQEWDEDYVERRITELSLHRGDVSTVTFGANPHTTGAIRGDLDTIDPADLAAQHPDLVAAAARHLTPTPGAGMTVDFARSIAAASRR